MREKIVQCQEGKLRGITDGEVAVFWGIPYAAPPVGELRWRGPQPARPWFGVRNAALRPPMPVQILFPNSSLGNHEMSEDCLYLNIWAPDTPDEKCPVLVWFYGGALQGGNADSPVCDGSRYAKDGVIVVTVGYRVGVFGFMCHPDMRRENSYEYVGNFGHRDQLAALKWIRENISSFGGDPDRVTVSGQSAGSASCCALLNAPAAKGYLHGAICQSGDIFQPERDVPVQEAEEWGKALAESFGCDSLDEFRRVPFPEMYREGDPMMKRIHQICAAVIDGAFLPGPQGELMLQNKCQAVPIILGSNLDEGSRSAAEAYVAAVSRRLQLPDGLYPEEDINKRADAIARDYWYGRHLAWARIRALDFGLPTWQYVFARRITPGGASHGMEIPYAFGNLNVKPDFGVPQPYTQEDTALSALIHQYWVNFVKNGDPNGEGLPLWPRKGAEPVHMQFDVKSGLENDVLRSTDAITSPLVEKWMRSRM